MTKATPRPVSTRTADLADQYTVLQNVCRPDCGLTLLDLAPLLKVPFDHLFRVPRLLHSAYVEGPVLTRERANTAHVVAILSVLFPAKDVERGVG